MSRGKSVSTFRDALLGAVVMTFATSLQANQIEISWALTVLVASSALYALIAQLVTACLAWWMQTAVQYRLDVKHPWKVY